MDEERKINIAVYPGDHRALRALVARGQSLADVLHAILVSAGIKTDEDKSDK